MKKIFSVVLLLAACVSAGAQKFDYNIGFDYLFNNYEYGVSRYFVGEDSYYPYQYSHTLHGVRLTPEAGLLLAQSPSVYHRLRIGIDVFKQMGQEVDNIGLFREIILYYNIEAYFQRGRHLQAWAGCFPRRFSSGSGYLGPVWDAEAVWLDPNFEGLLVKYSIDKRLRAELIFDWPGMIGDDQSPYRRERFQVLTDGSWRFAGDFSLGWTASLYHLSKSPMVNNVVNYDILNPRLEWAPFTWMDDMRLELGGLFTYQMDRASGNAPAFPMGIWSLQTVSKWNVSITNRFYWGDDLMPLDYGRELYVAEPSFGTLHASPSWCDWLTIAYRPRISKWLSLDLAVTLHAGQPVEALGFGVFRGSDQRIGLRVDFDALRPHPRKPKAPAKKGYSL